MKVVFASRTGNVQSIVDRLSVDALEISSGDEAVMSLWKLNHF